MVDFQCQRVPAIDQGRVAVRNVARVLDMASVVGVPIIFTEQNARTQSSGRQGCRRLPETRQKIAISTIVTFAGANTNTPSAR